MSELSIKPMGGRRYEVMLDGHDISNEVSSVFVSIDAHSMVPQVTLSLVATVNTELRRMPADVKLSPGDHELLTLLGWTPPEEES